MENKRILLAQLLLWQEAARNAQKEGLDRVVFEPKQFEQTVSDLREYIEDAYNNAGKVLGNFAQSLKEHWLHSPSLYPTIDKELLQALENLNTISGKEFPESGMMRITIEDGEEKTVRTFDTSMFKFFYLGDDTIYSLDCARNGGIFKEFLFYSALQMKAEELNQEFDGTFDEVYRENLKEFGSVEVPL